MKVCAILHQSKEGWESFKEKLMRIPKDKSDIIIGSYDSLSLPNSCFSSYSHKKRVYDCLSEISSRTSSLLIPGTLLYPINSTEAVCEAPVFHEGKLLHTFWKEKDNGEEDLSEANGYRYKAGDNSKNRFNFKNKNIAIELCGDHGVQNVNGCDLELILAFDKRAGFWISASNDSFSRFAIVCDGYAPKTEGFRYNHIEPMHKLGFLKECQLNQNASLFELDERNVHCL